jgi:hypothetical protein
LPNPTSKDQLTKNLIDPKFVSREKELDELKKGLTSALTYKGCVMLVSGEAGSGKTRLITEFLFKTKETDFHLFSGWCLSRANIPYFPFIEAFSSYSQNVEIDSVENFKVGQLISWLKEPITQKGENFSPQMWKDQAFAAIAKELLFMSTIKPVVFVFEDIHWADTASLALFHYLSRALIGERIFLLGTYRIEELSVVQNGQLHPLMETLRVMNREELFHEIKLGALSQSDVLHIAESLLGEKVALDFGKLLFERSNGNPLFVIESIRMQFESGNLVLKDGEWQLKEGRMGIPHKVKEIILRRVDALGSTEKRVLDVASVIDDKFDPTLIGLVMSIDSLSVLEALNRILHTTALVKVENASYMFDHAMSRETIYGELSLPLKQGYHEKIANLLEIKNVAPSILAYHYSLAGNNSKTVYYKFEAGKDALARYSNAEAINNFRWLLESASINSEQKIVAIEGLGDAYFASNLFNEALKVYTTLADESSGSIRQRALIRAIFSAFFQGNFPIIEQLVNRAESYPDITSIEKARILHQKGVVHNTLKLQSFEAWKLCEKSLKIFEEEYSIADMAWLLFVVADYAAAFGQTEEPLAYVLRSIEYYDELGDLRSKMEAYNEAGIVFQNCGLYAESKGLLEKVLEIEKSSKMGNYIMLAKAYTFLSQLTELAGNIDEALEFSKKALMYSDRAKSKLVFVRASSNLVRQCAKTGKLEEAQRVLDGLLKRDDWPKHRASLFLIELAKTTLMAAQSDLAKANEAYERYLQAIRQNLPNKVMINFILAEYCWFLKLKGDLKRAQEVKSELEHNMSEYDRRFAKANVKAFFIAKTNVETQIFEVRLDIVNISRSPCSVSAIRDVVCSGLELVDSSVGLDKNGLVEQGQGLIGAFSVKPVIFHFKACRLGEFVVSPKVFWIDKFGNESVCVPNQLSLTVKQAVLKAPEKADVTVAVMSKVEPVAEVFVFSDVNAEKAFDFLVCAFIRDYMLLKMSSEQSGWRTLTQVIKDAKVPKSSMYGFENRKGKALIELEKRGFVEARFFVGQRGRGGKILRLKICNDKDVIKRHIDFVIHNKVKK